MNARRVNLLLRIIVLVAPLLPIVVLAWDLVQGNLSANPIRDIQLRTGSAALNLLMLSLACTPLFIFTGYRPVLSFARPLGLYAFFYVLFHFINFIGIDYGLNFSLIQQDLFEKRYAVAGFAAFLLLLPVAILSIKRLRVRFSKTWFKISWLVYLAAAADVTHFIWQTKGIVRAPYIYLGILTILLVVRLPVFRSFIETRLRKAPRPLPAGDHRE